jgi:hypothetical protein
MYAIGGGEFLCGDCQDKRRERELKKNDRRWYNGPQKDVVKK